MIRTITNEDFDKINQLLKDNFKTKELFEDPFSHYLLYELQDVTVGFISYSNLYDHFDLNYIWVDEKYRKLGYAQELIQKMIEDAKAKGISKITLEVSENNIPALSLYQKLGFVAKTIRKGYYGKENGILMVLEIR